MLKLSEANITDQVRGFLEHRGWRAIRLNRSLVQMPFGGAVQFGECGMPDFQFVRYVGTGRAPCLSLTLWVEFKATGIKARCRCATKKPRQRCTACDQAKWRAAERARGGVVWVVDSLGWVEMEYERVFGWLHSGDAGRGQLMLELAGVGG